MKTFDMRFDQFSYTLSVTQIAGLYIDGEIFNAICIRKGYDLVKLLNRNDGFTEGWDGNVKVRAEHEILAL